MGEGSINFSVEDVPSGDEKRGLPWLRWWLGHAHRLPRLLDRFGGIVVVDADALRFQVIPTSSAGANSRGRRNLPQRGKDEFRQFLIQNLCIHYHFLTRLVRPIDRDANPIPLRLPVRSVFPQEGMPDSFGLWKVVPS